jgi:hypothetical protein
MKKIRRDKPIGVIIHMYMEMSQGNSLYLKHAKMSFFSFFFHKIRQRERGTVPAQKGVWYQWKGRRGGELG